MTHLSPPIAVVTGGAGAIGCVLVGALLRQGATVRVLDNLSSGKLSNLQEVASHPCFRFVQADLRQSSSLPPILEGATEVWHLAANPDIRRGTKDPTLDFDHGIRATFHLLEAARAAQVRRFLFSSSSVVSGLPHTFPTPEEYGPLLPHSLYGSSKLASEALISAFCHSYGIQGMLFRFANIVGPGMTHGIIYDFLKKLHQDPTRLEVLGDGRQAKSYLWTEDCVQAMLVAREKSTETVSIYNLGNEDQITARAIAEKVVASLGGKARIETTGGERGWIGDIPRQHLAIDKIRALGWMPRYRSAEAVDRTIPLLRKEIGI